MTSSMTAFTRQQSDNDWGTLVWEIRSVNHRYLEPGFRLPETLGHLEGRLREMLRGQLSRGKIEARLKFTPNATATPSIQLNETLLEQLSQAAQLVRMAVPDTTSVDPMEVLRWPGVIHEQEEHSKAMEDEALNLFQTALEALAGERRREGGELADTIRNRLESAGNILVQIRTAMPAIHERQKQKIQARFDELKLEVDPSRLEQEIVLALQKADITEELDRLETHLEEAGRLLGEDGAVGRRLDFLMQEMNREANTISSKAVVSETTLNSVELKVLVEQMREQVQNIE